MKIRTKFDNFAQFRMKWLAKCKNRGGRYRIQKRGHFCCRFCDLEELAEIYADGIRCKYNTYVKFNKVKKGIILSKDGEVIIQKGGCVLCPYQS
jgi:hypothetical protein